jgi:prevent-host-death family protein
MTRNGGTGREQSKMPILVCETTAIMTPAEIRVALRPLVSLLAKQAAREWLKGGEGDNTSDNSKLISCPSPTTDDSLMIKNGHSDYVARGNPLSTETWTVVEAKAKFSQIIDKARTSGPQTVTKNGRPAVVIVPAEEWERKIRRSGNLAEFFAESPLRESGLEAPRTKDGDRQIDL